MSAKRRADAESPWRIPRLMWTSCEVVFGSVIVCAAFGNAFDEFGSAFDEFGCAFGTGAWR